jgi:hypothetical protein
LNPNDIMLISAVWMLFLGILPVQPQTTAPSASATYTTLFTVRGYRLKIRTTIRDPEPNINGAVTFVRTLLRGVLNGKLAG